MTHHWRAARERLPAGLLNHILPFTHTRSPLLLLAPEIRAQLSYFVQSLPSQTRPHMERHVEICVFCHADRRVVSVVFMHSIYHSSDFKLWDWYNKFDLSLPDRKLVNESYNFIWNMKVIILTSCLWGHMATWLYCVPVVWYWRRSFSLLPLLSVKTGQVLWQRLLSLNRELTSGSLPTLSAPPFVGRERSPVTNTDWPCSRPSLSLHCPDFLNQIYPKETLLTDLTSLNRFIWCQNHL